MTSKLQYMDTTGFHVEVVQLILYADNTNLQASDLYCLETKYNDDLTS